jgi:hypothetical protein
VVYGLSEARGSFEEDILGCAPRLM